MLKTRNLVFYDYSVKRRKLPPEGLFFKNSKNSEGANESLPFFIWKPISHYNSQLSSTISFAYNNGTERNGTERNGTERNGTERNGTERNGTERNGTERNENCSK